MQAHSFLALHLRVGVLKAIADERGGCHRRSCAHSSAPWAKTQSAPLSHAATHEQLARYSLIAGDLLRSVRITAATAFQAYGEGAEADLAKGKSRRRCLRSGALLRHCGVRGTSHLAHLPSKWKLHRTVLSGSFRAAPRAAPRAIGNFLQGARSVTYCSNSSYD
jgi:hypothetical protein